ncbi:T9SS type A sorting domain-containing protein [Tamlana crocina]|uniref:T9SS type A sorting domain-containing protein n=1 Tax=Tamlana crocina TaxID=393006 RepID=A0ABX1DFU2_9FLAO|nr:T9SS type A sorting domain-containing protein [Tamlana crocina]NJX15166.1 T9SS type A sorting domain-containing protein [Tamlana crocina]
MKKTYFLLMALLFSCTLLSQQTYVPDDHFEQALIELGYDNRLDDYVSTSTIQNITHLDVSSKDISSLTGIEAFIGLKSLNCNFNNIQTLNVTSITGLEALRCAFNKLSSLDVEQNKNLNYLDCGFNNLSVLHLANSNLLTGLYCDFNALTGLDVRNGNNTLMTIFGADNNPDLSCIEVDNVSYSNANWPKKDATASYSADCDGGTIPDADLTYVPDNNFEQALIDLGLDDKLDDYVATDAIKDVEKLNVTGKGISDMTGIEAFVSLTELSCGSNNLTTLDVSSLVSLGMLNCYDNKLVSLDLSNNRSLWLLSCFRNSLIGLDLSGNPALKVLSAGGNAFTWLNVANGNNSNFTYFVVSGNPDLTCIEVDNVSYSNANWPKKDATASYSADCDGGTIPDADLTYVPDNNFEQALIDLGLDDKLDDYVATDTIKEVEKLNVTGKGISDLTGIEAFVSLTELSCGSNNLTTLDVSSLVSLGMLNCYDNKLVSLDLSNNRSLWLLSCFRNSLIGLDLSGNPALKVLSAGGNAFTWLNVANGNNSNFTYFVVSGNPELTCIEVDNVSYSNANWPKKDATASYSADCDGGTIPDADLTYVPDNNFEQALIDLGLDDKLDDYVATDTIKEVEKLNVTGKGISDLTGIEAFVSLTELSCGSNNLTTLDVSSLVSLGMLNCYDNKLVSLDLSNNRSLWLLSCFRNSLIGLDLSGNPALKVLSAGGNAFTWLNVANGNNEDFTYFVVSGNPELTCIEVDNVSYSNANWPKKDATASYSTNCSVSARSTSKSEKEIAADNMVLGAQTLDDASFKLYPNPVNDILNIKLNHGVALKHINVYSVYGQLIFSKNAGETIDVKPLNNGVYYVEIETNIGTSTKRIIVKK